MGVTSPSSTRNWRVNCSGGWAWTLGRLEYRWSERRWLYWSLRFLRQQIENPVTTDPTVINRFYVNSVGVGVPGVNDETTIPEVHVELERGQFHQHSSRPKRRVSDNGAWSFEDANQRCASVSVVPRRTILSVSCGLIWPSAVPATCPRHSLTPKTTTALRAHSWGMPRRLGYEVAAGESAGRPTPPTSS